MSAPRAALLGSLLQGLLLGLLLFVALTNLLLLSAGARIFRYQDF